MHWLRVSRNYGPARDSGMCVTSTSPAKDGDGDYEHEIFVPGRLGFFGEHSDWAGALRKYV